MIKQLLQERDLPSLLEREEMLTILQREEYGFLPPKPESIHFEITENIVTRFCAGKAKLNKVHITVELAGKPFTFPMYASIPTAAGKHPFFVCINFRDCIPDLYIPVEEIIDSGYALLSFCYQDVTSDSGDFTDGLAGILYENGERKAEDAGKIAMWAWAAQRVLDYAETLDCLDMERCVVCGHSRLGKTALLAAATDTRFRYAYSNDSGCGGAALFREKIGENIECICRRFPYWFCENFKSYAGREYSLPFDQHYLLASIAPRGLYVASAKEDTWADPDSEMLCCAAASAAYEAYGQLGFVGENRLPVVGDTFHKGDIGYHMRAGEHYFSREDWAKVIQYLNQHG